MDFSATDTAKLAGLNVPSVNAIFLKLRVRIAQFREAQSPYSGKVKLDESCFGPRRVRGKKGRGTGGKAIVFGIFIDNGHVFTEIAPDARKRCLYRNHSWQSGP